MLLHRAARVVVVILCSIGVHGQTVPIAVVNSGFEAPAIAAGSFETTAPPPGWTGYGPLDFGFRTIGVLNPATTTLYAVAPPDGSNVGVVFLLDDPGNPTIFAGQEAGLTQTLDTALQGGRSYVLRVEVGNIAVDPDPPHNVFAFAGFPGYRVELRAGGVTVAADVNTLAIPEGEFRSAVVAVDIAADHPQIGELLSIRLGNLNQSVGIEVNFDDVRLESSPIAPPNAWSAQGGALAGIAGEPLLVGNGPLDAVGGNTVELSQAAPGAPAALFAALSSTPVPFKGGLLLPIPFLTPLLFVTGPAGTLPLGFVLPAGVPAGTELWLQWAIQDAAAPFGVALSNAILGQVP